MCNPINFDSHKIKNSGKLMIIQILLFIYTNLPNMSKLFLGDSHRCFSRLNIGNNIKTTTKQLLMSDKLLVFILFRIEFCTFVPILLHSVHSSISRDFDIARITLKLNMKETFISVILNLSFKLYLTSCVVK